LGRSATLSSTQRSRSRGFSMVELAVSMTVMLILTAIAIPSLMRSFRTYQLNDAASRVSDMLKFTRFEAVRRNIPVTMQIKTSGTNWNVWTDSNNDGNEDPTEKQILVSGFVTLLPAGAPPGTGGFVTPLGTSNFTIVSGSNGTVIFDARGAVRVGNALATSVDVFYLGSSTNQEFGYRAVLLLPSGATQIWTAPAGGTWQRIG
jgi:prepilin-type N-terminal cleavage/methylation domain-containing protein